MPGRDWPRAPANLCFARGEALPGPRARLLISIPLLAVIVAAGAVLLSPRFLARSKALRLVDETTLVVLKGEVELARSDGSRAKISVTSDDTVVRVGDQVRTGPADYACLTYINGSTTEL